MRRVCWAVIALFCFAGCESGPSGVEAIGPDAGSNASPMPDAGLSLVVFEPEAPANAEAAHLALSAAAVTDSSLRLDIVAHGLEAVQGIAFRIVYAPGVLAFEALVQGPAWTHDGVWMVNEVEPGLVVVALSAKGRAPGLVLDDAAIAQLRFRRLRAAETEVALRRPFLMLATGRPAPISALGGVLRSGS